MRLFSWIKRKAETVAVRIAEGYKEFTGQSTFEEADRLYEEVMQRFNEHKAYFEKEVEKTTTEIDKHVKEINKSKMIIKTELLPAFAEKAKHLYDITVSEDFLKECYNGSTLKVDSMKSRQELFLIDFNKNPFKTNALAIVTLGFYTRKKAKETLIKVKEEKKRLEEEMTRMDSELSKLHRIEEALRNIGDYYASLIDVYNQMLVRFDNSVNFLMIKCLAFARKLIKQQMSVRLLPKSQQKEVEAMVTISKIMKAMADAKITIDGSVDSVSNVKSDLKSKSENVRRYFEAA